MPDPLTNDVLPQPDSRQINKLSFLSIGLTVVALVMALVDNSIVDALRVWLVGIAAVMAGAAISWLPFRSATWGLAAVTALVGRFALPNSWDSAQLLLIVMGAIAVAAALLLGIPKPARRGLLSLYFLFHFGNMMVATTLPLTPAWISQQLAIRIYNPYMTFLYLGNAYHFYSPEPGPASHFFFLITVETDEPNPETGKKISGEWLTMPTRPEQVKDPLALSYYRRLSLTELAAPTIPEYLTPATFEKSDAYRRRTEVSRGLLPGYPRIPIPGPPDSDPPYSQYRVPMPEIAKYILPSYTRHILHEAAGPGRRPISVKVYRLEHRIIPPSMYAIKADPYHPTTYRPYFLGEFDTQGNLIDPQDPMLYWLIPILYKPVAPSAGADTKDYVDYLSLHAGFSVVWRRP